MKSVAHILLALPAVWMPCACVTESRPPAVSIHAGSSGSIYPPAVLYGTWISQKRVIVFQQPPRAPVMLGSAVRPESYDVATLRRNTEGSYTMRLAPREGGPTVERTFFLPEGNRLREVENGEVVLWTRSDE